MNFESRKIVVTLFPKTSGGRRGAIKMEYTPNSVFGIDLSLLEDYWDGNQYIYDKKDDEDIRNAGIRIDLNDVIIFPGGIGVAKFYISNRSLEYIGEALLKTGISFFLREGSRIIGTGLIID
jgi:hypothetical protein